MLYLLLLQAMMKSGTESNNFLELFDGWNFVLRMYQPTEAYTSGKWAKPELVMNKGRD